MGVKEHDSVRWMLRGGRGHRDARKDMNLIGARSFGKKVPFSHPGMLRIAKHQLLHGEKTQALDPYMENRQSASQPHMTRI